MQLLEHFNELSLHPKNAKELKGLILQFAVQGKLTKNWREKNPNMEQASVLLERIKKEKEQLVKEKKIKKENPLQKITDEEIPYGLPESWVWCRLGQIASLINGDRGKNYPSKDHYVQTGIPFITARNLGDRFLKHGELNYISEERYAMLNSGQIELDDILYCLRGSLGKCAIVEGIEQGAIASSLCIVRSYSAISSNFLLNYFLCPLGKEIILRHDNGTAQPNLSASDVKTFVFPLPPLEEQKAIVQVVNQLFAEVDQLENLTKERIHLKEDFVTSALKQLSTGYSSTEWSFLKEHFSTFFTEKASIKKLRESILQLAVQGKLTSDWRKLNPNIENAKVLLERIKKEKEQLIKEKKIKKENPLPRCQESDFNVELPSTWNWCRFAEIVINRDGDRKPITKSDRIDGDYDYYGASGVIDKVKDFIFDKDLLLIGEDGANLIARSKPIAFFATGQYWVNNHAHVIDATDFTILEYLEKYINAINLENYITGMAQPKMPQKRMNIIPVPLPPLEEQKTIVKKVNSLMALCDELEAEIEISKTTQEKWMESSLREVFEWEIKN
jgi:type I restriction enzyme S subunit